MPGLNSGDHYTRRDKGTAIATFSKLLQDVCTQVEADRHRAAKELENYFDFNSGFIESSEAWQQTAFNYVTDKQSLGEALRQDFDLAMLAGISQVPSVDTVLRTLDGTPAG